MADKSAVVTAAKPDGSGFAHPMLSGCHILVVEDEYLLARDISAALTEHGAHVVGLCPDLQTAIDLIGGDEKIQGAVIDINLRGVQAFALAEMLQARGIAVVIASGYDVDILPEALAAIPCCAKPIDHDRLVMLLAQQMGDCR